MSRTYAFALAAVACALLAGWLTFSYTGGAARSTGPVRAVLVTTGPIERGELLGMEDGLALRDIPAHFAPPDALDDSTDAIGERLQVALPGGAFVTRSLLSGGQSAGMRFKLRAGERALTIDAVVSPSGEQIAPGNRVDLYASGYGGDQQTERVIAGAEVLAVTDGNVAERTHATVRLAADQVAAVVRADVFAHELRAVLRP